MKHLSKPEVIKFQIITGSDVYIRFMDYSSTSMSPMCLK